jgi:tetratricopeptide (TPR) repeat protein
MRSIPVAMLLSTVASVAVAQTPQTDARVATAMATAYGNRWTPTECSADKGLHFKVSSAKVYLKTAIETSVEGNKERALNNGERVILEAINGNAQGTSAGAWYYLGRIYLHRGDVAGADSALRRAVELAPDCAAEVDGFRRTAWAALVNPGIDYMKASKPDSARAVFLQASKLYRGAPHVYSYLGNMAYDAQDLPTALAYFDSAMAVKPDPKDAEVRQQVAYNRGVLLINMQRPAEAVAPLREYLKANPEDANAKKALYNAFVAAKMTDSATVLAKELETAGVQVGAAAGAGAAAGGAADSPFNMAVAAYNEQKWAEAAAAAEKAVAAEPFNRDALYMLARSNYELKRGPATVKAAERLIEVDPASERAYQMLGFGHNLTKNSSGAVQTRLKLNALPFTISLNPTAPSATGVSLSATITGRNATNAAGKAVPATPHTLSFEFLNKDGAVVATQEGQVPALKPGETFELKLEAQGQGISAWRYKIK